MLRALAKLIETRWVAALRHVPTQPYHACGSTSADAFGAAKEVSQQEALTGRLPVGFESQLAGRIPTAARTTQSGTSMGPALFDGRLRAPCRQPAPTRWGAAKVDLFDLLWEFTPDRSSASPQVNARRPVQHR